MRIRFLLLFIGFLFLNGSLLALPEQQKNNFKNSLPKGFVEQGFKFEIGKNRSEILKNLGIPNKIIKKKHFNSYSKENDLIYTYFYSGLTVTFLELFGPNNDPNISIMLISVSIYSNKWPLTGIKIGMSKEATIKYLGSTFVRSGPDNIIYHLEVEQTEVLDLLFSNNKLKKITWCFYIG